MLKTIQPQKRHILFFPYRRKNKIIVEDTKIWFWEKFKHIELGSLKLQINSNDIPLKTKEKFPCNVKASFKVKLDLDIPQFES